MLFPLLSKTSPLCPNACHAVRIVKRTATTIRLIIVFDAPQPWNVAFSYEDYISPSPLTAPDGRGSKKLNGTATFGSGRSRGPRSRPRSAPPPAVPDVEFTG